MTKVDIISGFLGAGKTTLIKKLLEEAEKGGRERRGRPCEVGDHMCVRPIGFGGNSLLLRTDGACTSAGIVDATAFGEAEL